MSYPLRFTLFAALLFAVCSGCGGSKDAGPGESVALDVPEGAAAYVPTLDGPLRLLSAAPQGTMTARAPEQAVAVTFSRPMVPLGEAPAPPPDALTLSPEVAGTLRWEGTQTLVFQPDEPLPLATRFTARLEGGLTAEDGEAEDRGAAAEPYSWSFETPRPRLAASEPSDGAAFADPQQAVAFTFNQPVEPESNYAELIRVEDQQRVAARLSAPSDTVLLLTPGQALAPGARYRARLLPGLPSAVGPLGLQDTATVAFSTYPPLQFTEVTQRRAASTPGGQRRTDAGFAPDGGLTLHFSTPVQFEDLRRAVSFAPADSLPPGIEARDGAVSTEHVLPVTLQPETNYTVTVRGLTDQFGQRLAEARHTFRTRALAPSLSVKSGLVVIEADEEAALPLRATNVEAVQLGAARLAPGEVIPLLRAYDTQRGYAYYQANAAPRMTAPDPVAAARTVPLGLARNTPSTTRLQLDSLLTGGTGLVGVHVTGPALDGQETDARALAQVTRLGLTAKFSPHQNLILVTDLETAQPVAGATVTIRDMDNAVRWRGQADAQGRARTPGWARLGLEKPNAWTAPTQFAFAEKGGDVAFTSSLYNEGLEPYRFNVNYDWNPEAETEAGSIFSDRGLYRTGETVHLKAMLQRRADADWQALTDSVRVLVRSPRDETVLDRRLKPTPLGTFDLDWAVPASAAQGAYEVRVAYPDDTTATDPYSPGSIAAGTFRVDAFRRATFAVDARAAAERYVAGDFFEGRLTGRYLFGAAMQGQPVRYALRRAPGAYQPPGYDAYRFGAAATDPGALTQTITEGAATLDSTGAFALRTLLPGNEAGQPTTLTWIGTVTDPAEQTISAREEITLHPGLFYIGLKPQTTFLDLSAAQTLPVDVIMVDPGGQPVAQEARVEVVRQQWNSVREVGADGRLRWRSERTEEPVWSGRVAVEQGQARRLSVKIQKGGSYVVRATGRDLRGNTVRTEAYVYATGAGYVAWARADDDRLDLVPEKERYRPGETAKLLVPSPYEEATALITVERDGILSSRVETLSGSAPQIEVPLTEAHLPNVFVSVILLKGRTAAPGTASDAGAPAFKVGYAELRVDPGARHLQVEVQPNQETYRPGEEVTVDLQLRDAGGAGVPGEIAFSAADAGVLNLTGYALPDPFEAFYGPRPLGVTTSELRASLIEQRSFGQKEEDVIGGGGEGDDLLRTDFRPLAHWAPAVQTDGQGRATVAFRLPESLTTFRFMAAALTADHQFGQGQTDVTVTQPLVLQPALPRFARLNDTFEAGVLVTNTTGAAGTATITAEGEGGLTLSGAAEKTVALADGEAKAVRFAWEVVAVDTARVQFSAALGGEQDAFEAALPVARPTAKAASATFASTDSTAQEALRVPTDRVPGLGHFQVQLSSTALVGLDGAVQYLSEYPYGCLEQQTSRVRPLLVARDVLDAFDVQALPSQQDRIVEDWLAGLERYWTGDGFSLWAGGRRANPYVTAYTVLALAEAEAAGFATPAELTRQATDALAAQVRVRSERPEYYTAAVWTDTRALMLYALTRQGRVLESEIAALAEAPGALSVEGVSTLLRAVVQADRPAALRRFQDALAERLRDRIRVEATTAYLSAPEEGGFGWIFSSDTRATAFGLTALLEAGAADFQPLAERMVRYLMQQRQGGHWASTQDNAATVEAFRTYFGAYEEAAPDFTATVRLAGRAVLQSTFQDRSLKVAHRAMPPDQLASAQPVPLSVTKDGAGTAYYALLLETYSAAPQAAAAQGLRVERQIQKLDARGQPLGAAQRTGGETVTLQTGDLVRVTLRLTTPTDRHYVVVDDALPAGLEALNAAFETTDQEAVRNAEAGQSQWWGSFNHTEIRDDRVLLFADALRRGEHTYTYVARATTPGTFTHPPAQAEMMYQPATRGQTATGTLVVQPAAGGVAAQRP